MEQQFMHRRDQGHLSWFAGVSQAVVVRLDDRVVPAGDERGHVQRTPHDRAAARARPGGFAAQRWLCREPLKART